MIAIDEYKEDSGGENLQTNIAALIERLKFCRQGEKETVKKYLQKHGHNVEIVVIDMSPSFKAAVDQA